MAVLLGEDVGGPRRTRCFSVRGDVPSKEGLGRAERDNRCRRPRRILAAIPYGICVSNRKSVRHGQRSKLNGFERDFLC
jgi:hypothetical protein